jgi:small subunit ribosomal protein S1
MDSEKEIGMGKFRFIDLDDELDESVAHPANEFADLLAQEVNSPTTVAPNLRTSDKVTAAVIQKGKDSLFVDLGSKQPGVIALSEYVDTLIPKVGDSVELFIKQITGSEIILTRALKAESTATAELLAAKEAGTPVEAKVDKVVNGGFQVKLGNSRAFVPISHMTLSGGPDSALKPEEFVGKSMTFQILEVKDGGKDVILSRRNLLKQAETEERAKLLGTLSEGETRTATISKLMPFGAFARLGPGVEGLIPLGELSWKRVAKAADVVTEGESVQVKIVKIEHSPKLRISLSLKDAGADPWLLLESRLQPGQSVTGTVSRLADFGAFVSIPFSAEGAPEGTPDSKSPEIEGLVHVSELSWTKRVRHPGDLVRPGQKETFTVLKVDPAERRLSLSLRGQMPEEMRAKAQALANARSGAPSEEDRALLDAWTTYQSEQQQASRARPDAVAPSGAGSAMAAAFAQARKRP